MSELIPAGYETLIHWLHFFLIVAAVCATIFPISYGFVPWYKSALGRVLMLHSVALALALDATVIYTYWTKNNFAVALWVNFAVFVIIAFCNLAFTVILVRTQYKQKRAPDTPQHDGHVIIEEDKDKKVVRFELESDPHDWEHKDEVIFKVRTS